MIAAGAYIQFLREHKGLSRAKMAEMIGTTDNTLWRIESGRQEPGALLLASIARLLNGSLERLGDLLLDEAATAEVGRQLAEAHFSSLPDDEARQQRDALRELVAELESNPKKYGQLLGYAARLREEQ